MLWWFLPLGCSALQKFPVQAGAAAAATIESAFSELSMNRITMDHPLGRTFNLLEM